MSRWRIAALLLAAAWWLIDLGVLGAGVPAPLDDTWEYGVVARHLLAGDGFRTGVIHPPLWGLRDATLTVPVLVHGPLLPLLLAPLIAAFGPGALDAMAWLAAAFAFATAVLLDRVIARHSGDLAAATCVALFTLSPLMLAAVHHDASMAIGGFFLIASIAALGRPRPRAVAAGLLVSVGALARPELVGAGVVLGVFGPAGARWPFFIALLVPRVAWIVYRGAATGMPLFDLSSYLLLADTSRYPELSALRRFDLPPDRFAAALRDAAPALAAKWAYALPRAVKHALTAPSVAIGWLAAVAVGVTLWRGAARAGDRARRARDAAAVTAGPATSSPTAAPGSQPSAPLALRDVALMAIPLALLVLTERRATLLAPFLPLWAWAAWRGTSALSRRATAMPKACAVLVVLAVSTGVDALMNETAESRHAAAWLGRERAALERAVAEWDIGGPGRAPTPAAGSAPESGGMARVPAEGERAAGRETRTIVVVSDTPDLVTWTTRRSSVWSTREEWRRLEGDPAAWPPGLPPAGAGTAVWFHENPRRFR